MKELNHSLSEGGGYWAAMLSSEAEKSREFVRHFRSVQKHEVFENAPFWTFNLQGRRTFTPNYEDYEGYSQEQAIALFAKEFPQGKHIGDLSDPSSNFSPVQDWANFMFVGPSFVDPPGNSSRLRILSEEVKNVLDTCHLAPHHYYPIELVHEISQESRRYYILHFLCDRFWLFREVIWEQSIPILFELDNPDPVKIFEKGIGGSYEYFMKEIYPKERTGEYNGIKMEQYSIRESYDLFPFGLSMLMSNKLADLLHSAGLEQAVSKNYEKTAVFIG